ncbi:hypothetical protein BDV32DRAFT_76968 [Aspergillus pseudonomiae]|nr:hypothetical protein BDV32DRAFT_76968 [Aspergillus pseudonomiae]
MTSPTREWRKVFGHKYRTSIERPQDYSMLGSASRPILIDCEDDRASGRDDADGDTIPETPSHRSLSSACYDSQTHLTLGHSESAAPTALAGGSPSYGEMAVQRSTHGECASTVSSLVESTESAVQNTRLGHAAESRGQAASDGEHIHDRSDCNDGMRFPPTEQNSNWAAKTDTLFDCPGSMPVQSPGSQSDSVTSVLAHRSTQKGGMEFLCLKVEWHSYSELRLRAPQLLTNYVHHASFRHSPRGRKRRAVSEVPLMSKHPKRARGQ